MNTAHNLPESSSLRKTEIPRKKLLTESSSRRRIEGAARVPFLGTLLEEEWEVSIDLMRTEQAVVWTELLSWTMSGQLCSATGPVDIEKRSQPTTDAECP